MSCGWKLDLRQEVLLEVVAGSTLDADVVRMETDDRRTVRHIDTESIEEHF